MSSALIGLQVSLTFPLIGLYFMISHNWFFLSACNKVDNKPSLAQVNISPNFCSLALPCCWKVEWIDIDVEYTMIKHKNLYGIKPWTFIQPGSWNQPWHWHSPEICGACLWKAQHSSERHGQNILTHRDLCTGAVAELVTLIERRKMMKTLAWRPWPFSGRAGSPGWNYDWYSSLSTAVVVAQTHVVKHADEAANAHQIFIRPGKAALLVREDEIEGVEAITLHHGSLLSASPLALSLPTLIKLVGSLRTM